MYAHRPSPSFSKVILRLFAIVSIVFLLYYGYSTFAENELQKRLYELGYPTEGFIVVNNTMKFADGHIVRFEGNYVEDYPITAEEALNILNNYLAEYNLKLKKYDMRIEPEIKSMSEKEENGKLYWVFELYIKKGSSKFFAGLAYVERKQGLVKIKGLLD
ncbi:hypothetical protein [Pyrococcus yayanosii]|uniref:Uncharacterized protein n=1 Tax=Pyrococcus yayanosii (strain CH1 / JCM 16557) TaxID=529709 RepID=F8AG39_PYRYC|nr:hypothetical protein [Pyrococcus yayanosii]AEH25093.1 hypothetical protein PYCH_14230 [Pyrococcus yayanosii CH1]